MARKKLYDVETKEEAKEAPFRRLYRPYVNPNPQPSDLPSGRMPSSFGGVLLF